MPTFSTPISQEYVSAGRRRNSAKRLSVPPGAATNSSSKRHQRKSPLKVSPLPNYPGSTIDDRRVDYGFTTSDRTADYTDRTADYASTMSNDHRKTTTSDSRIETTQEKYLEEPPPGMPSEDKEGNPIRYVEVPVIEEVIRQVPIRQEVVIEKYVPRIEEIWVDKIVEVPEVVYQDKFIDVPVHEEFITHVTKHEIVEVPREYVRHVPKVKTVTIEKTVEVPGEIVQVPRPYIVENKISVPRVIDKQVPVLVSQIVQPVLTGLAKEEKTVQVVNYEPHFHVVDVPVVRPLHSCLINNGVMHEECRVVQVPPGQYNTILRHLNRHLDCPGKTQYLPYISDTAGEVMFVDENACLPKGPVAVPMPLLNSPSPAYTGANINGPVVPPAQVMVSTPPRVGERTAEGAQMAQIAERAIAPSKHRHHHHHRHRHHKHKH